MPRPRKKPNDPTARTHGVTVLFNATERALVERVAASHGISRGAAVRMMMMGGAPKFDPEAN